MNELEMIKAFAELDGVKVEYPMFNDLPYYRYSDADGVHLAPYNPLLPNHLNCKARDKYRVEVDYGGGYVSLWTRIDRHTLVYFESTKDLPEAIIECILKSEGLWRD